MSAPYRDAVIPRRPRVLATTRGLTLPWFLVACAVAAAILTVVSHRVRVDCVRASGECTSRDERLFGEATVAYHPLATLRGARVATNKTSRVALITTTGLVEITSTSETATAGMNEMAIAINRFLPGADPELHVSYGGVFGTETSWIFALIGFLGVVVSRRPVRTRVTFDPEERLVVVERTFAGRTLFRAEVDASAITSASRATSLDGAKGASRWYFQSSTSDHFVALCTASGERTPLPEWSTPGLQETQALIDSLNDALGLARGPVAETTSAPSAVVRCGLPAVHAATTVAFLGIVGMTSVIAHQERRLWAVLPMFPVLLVFGARFAAGATRRVLVHASEGKVVVESSTFGLFPARRLLRRGEIQRAVVDRRDRTSSGVALLLDTGEHVALTMYSNMSFGAKGVAEKVNAALEIGEPAD
jgi:hypothetical protein